MGPDMELIEERQYICRRVSYVSRDMITEQFHSWVGEDTESLREWERSLMLDGNDFDLAGEGISEGSGELSGRRWSWDEIEYSYVGEDGLHYRFSGEYSGARCLRAGVATDDEDEVVHLISDRSSVISDEEYAVLLAIYGSLERGER